MILYYFSHSSYSISSLLVRLWISFTYSKSVCILRFEHVDDVVKLPYFGGARGQVLEIRQRKDGTIFSRILTDDVKDEILKEEGISQKQRQTTTTVKPVFPLESPANRNPEDMSFESNLISIQNAAASLVALQEHFKNRGNLTRDQQREYAANLEKLGVSAQKLAQIQQETGDDFRLLFDESILGDRVKGGSKKKPDNVKFPGYGKKPIEPGKKEECGGERVTTEENVGEEGEAGETSTTTKAPTTASDNESISVSSPEEEAAIAEAKPVGLAIAGDGGVASSKPIATAVVGPGGLAVARPVATAIAGVKPSEVSQLGLPVPAKFKDIVSRDSVRDDSIPTRGKYGLATLSDDETEKILVGPNFYAEARLSDKGIDADDDQENDESEMSESEVKMEDSRSKEKKQKLPSYYPKDRDNVQQIEPVESEFEYVNQKLIPSNLDTYYNYVPNPYLPPHSYGQIPLINQYLQRRAFNPYRYPYQVPFGSPYPYPIYVQ